MNRNSQAAPEVVSDFNLEDFSWDNPTSEEVITSVDDSEDPEKGSEEGSGSGQGEEGEENPTDKTKPAKVVVSLNEKGETEEELEKGDPKQKGGKAKENDTPAGAGTGTENLEFLRQKGLISFEDEELQAEDFDEEEFIETKLEETVNGKLEELLTNLPPGLKDMIKYSANGGDFMEVVQDLTTSTELPLDLTLESEEEQKSVIKATLKKEGKSLDEINNYIEFLEFKNRLATEAKTRYDKYTIEEETKEEKRLEKLKSDRIARQQKIEADKKSLGEYMKEKPQILGNVKLSRTDMKELPGYIHEPAVKLEDGRVTTKFNYDLVQALKDQEKALLIAKITKSDFNMKDFMQTLETKVINKIENGLQEKDFGKASGSSQQKISGQKAHLVDFL